MPRQPTRKQKKAVKILLENPSLTTSEVMRQAGYSEASIVDPNKNLLDTKGFIELVGEILPDSELLAAHKAGLNATLIKTAQFEGSITDEKEYADYPTRHKYLETAYRIKGRLDAPNSDKTGDINVTLAIYGNTEYQHTVSVSAKRVPNAISQGDGRRIQSGGNSVAPEIGQGQDGSPGSN